MERNVTIVKDLNGKNIVLINDIYFKGRQNIEWKEVEKYLKRYVGEFIEVVESKDLYTMFPVPNSTSTSKRSFIRLFKISI